MAAIDRNSNGGVAEIDQVSRPWKDTTEQVIPCGNAGNRFAEEAQPEIVLLPDEPYPFSAEDLEDFYTLDIPAAHSDRIHLVDGKLLTWYGPRMASSLTQLAALLG